MIEIKKRENLKESTPVTISNWSRDSPCFYKEREDLLNEIEGDRKKMEERMTQNVKKMFTLFMESKIS